jgi:hypothetical protein
VKIAAALNITGKATITTIVDASQMEENAFRVVTAHHVAMVPILPMVTNAVVRAFRMVKSASRELTVTCVATGLPTGTLKVRHYVGTNHVILMEQVAGQIKAVGVAATVHMLVTAECAAAPACKTAENVNFSRLAQNVAIVFIGIKKQQHYVVVIYLV